VRCVTAKQKGLVRDAERKCLLIELLVGRRVHDFYNQIETFYRKSLAIIDQPNYVCNYFLQYYQGASIFTRLLPSLF